MFPRPLVGSEGFSAHLAGDAFGRGVAAENSFVIVILYALALHLLKFVTSMIYDSHLLLLLLTGAKRREWGNGGMGEWDGY